MADVVNLRTVRKQKSRDLAKARATEASAKTGRSKAQRLAEQTEADKLQRHLDAHKKE